MAHGCPNVKPWDGIKLRAKRKGRTQGSPSSVFAFLCPFSAPAPTSGCPSPAPKMRAGPAPPPAAPRRPAGPGRPPAGRPDSLRRSGSARVPSWRPSLPRWTKARACDCWGVGWLTGRVLRFLSASSARRGHAGRARLGKGRKVIAAPSSQLVSGGDARQDRPACAGRGRPLGSRRRG